MTDLYWALALTFAGVLGLFYPYLMKRCLESKHLKIQNTQLFLTVLDRFERRAHFSVLLVAVGLLWLFTEL